MGKNVELFGKYPRDWKGIKQGFSLESLAWRSEQAIRKESWGLEFRRPWGGAKYRFGKYLR
eukprot:4196683-Karenia_brevis.AAC.1